MPQDSAFAAMSTPGIGSVSSRWLPVPRWRYFVPKRWEPRDSDSAPMEAKPWFCSRT